MSAITPIESLRASAAQTTGTETASLPLNDNYDLLVATLDVTLAATDASDTLDVYIDTSFDGGVSWVNIGHFTQVLGNGGAKKFIMSFKANPITSNNSVSATADQASGAALQCGFGSYIRYRGVVVDASTTNASFTYSVGVFLQKK